MTTQACPHCHQPLVVSAVISHGGYGRLAVNGGVDLLRRFLGYLGAGKYPMTEISEKYHLWREVVPEAPDLSTKALSLGMAKLGCERYRTHAERGFVVSQENT